MTLWQLSALAWLLMAAMWTAYVVVVRHLESDPGGWVKGLADGESTRTAWLAALAHTGAAVERQLAREFKRRGRLLLGPRRSTALKQAKARRNGGAR